jgi:ubiquinone/menaquinone biosynthesis C-methylase UbiE
MVAAVPQSAQAFSADAGKYDALRRGLVPCFDAFYGQIGDLMADWGGPEAPRVLDLGAGTGLVASFVLAARPQARLTLMDGSDAMLDVARGRFGLVPHVRYVLADFSSSRALPSITSSMPASRRCSPVSRRR